MSGYQEMFGKIPTIWKKSSDCEEGCWDPGCETDCDGPSSCDSH